MRFRKLILVAGLLLGGISAARAAEADGDLARQGPEILKKYCYECHGAKMVKPPLDVTDREVMLKGRSKPYLVPGKPDQSVLWKRLDSDMPPEDKPQPTDAERAILKRWIEAGAPMAQPQKRRFLGEKHILSAVYEHMRQLPHEDRPFHRYFTLTHLYSNPSASDGQLRMTRAGLSKLLNSLSWEADVVVPQAIDKEQTVYTVDLRRLGWTRGNLWHELLIGYPFGLRHDTDRDASLRLLYKNVTQMSYCELPYVRADWFVYAASRPPLYHKMLRLPTDLGRLERMLNVDLEKNFRTDRLVRAGMMQSGVSRHNRVVERHPGLFGAYWRSYDFGSSAGRGDILRFPLGPEMPGYSEYNRYAFKQAGGEVIFSLPNKLHGYMLADAADKRLDRAPISIVRDHREASGTPEVINGVSCMQCHKHGVITFKDDLLRGHGVRGEAEVKVQRLYRRQAIMDQWLKRDESEYLGALEQAVGPFLKAGEDKDKDLRSFDDPVGTVARSYLQDMDADYAACELGLPHGDKLKTIIKYNSYLRRVGLMPLAEGGRIKREVWEQVAGTSRFQDVARMLELGSPYIELPTGRKNHVAAK
jgi:serine/threonine-protein kinase